MRDTRRFQRGSGVFKCIICKRNTRYTGQGVDELCLECYELASLDNQYNDDGAGPPPADSRDRKAMFAWVKSIRTKGGDSVAAMDSCGYLFTAEEIQNEQNLVNKDMAIKRNDESAQDA